MERFSARQFFALLEVEGPESNQAYDDMVDFLSACLCQGGVPAYLAGDAAVDAIDRNWERRERLDREEDFTRKLVRTAFNVALVDKRRSTGYGRCSTANLENRVDPHGSSPIDEVRADEAFEALLSAMHSMSQEDREIVQLRLLDHWDFLTIARRIGGSEECARQRFQRAKARFFERLARNEASRELGRLLAIRTSKS